MLLSSATRRSRPRTDTGRPIRRRLSPSLSHCSDCTRDAFLSLAQARATSPSASCRVDHLIAVEPSRSMLERAVHRDGAVGAHVEWLAIAAEDYAFDRRYSAVVAAEAFHWLDWHAVLPRIADSLVRGGHLILVERTLVEPLPWEPDLRVLIREYSTNQDHVPSH